MSIHPTAIISKEAQISPKAHIGPYVHIRGHVHIEKDVFVDSFSVLGAPSSEVFVGQGTRIFPGVVVGEAPQHLEYKGEKVGVRIGRGNTFREYCTIHAGTSGGRGVTQIGDNNLLMAYCHVAHDCKLGNGSVLANSAQLAGFVELEDFVRIGGVCAVSQFVRIGKQSYVAAGSVVNKDILPFSIAQGVFAVMRAFNRVGMERSGYSKSEMQKVKKSIKTFIKMSGTVSDTLEKLKGEFGNSPSVLEMVEFAQASQRGLAL